MPKQYTFKTTKPTAWMEDILDSISPQDRSVFIRELLSLGMKAKGIEVGSMVPVVYVGVTPTKDKQLSHTIQRTEVTQKTNVSPIEIDSMEEIEEDVSIEDLESRLNEIGGI